MGVRALPSALLTMRLPPLTEPLLALMRPADAAGGDQVQLGGAHVHGGEAHLGAVGPGAGLGGWGAMCVALGQQRQNPGVTLR